MIMPKLTVLQAAAQGWSSRHTIYRHVRNGKLSAEKDAEGRTVIDTAELVRAYGEPVARNGSQQDQCDSLQQGTTPVDLATLRAENAQLREDLADARQHRDRLMNLLEAYRPRRRGWWARLTGRGED